MTITAMLVQQVAGHQIHALYAANIERAIRNHPDGSRLLTKSESAAAQGSMINVPVLAPLIDQLYRPTPGNGILYWFTLGPVMFLTIITVGSLYILNLATALVAYNQTDGWGLRGELTVIYVLPLVLLTIAGIYSAFFPYDMWNRAVRAMGPPSLL